MVAKAFSSLYIRASSRGSVTVAFEAHNLEVVGAIPAPGTRKELAP